MASKHTIAYFIRGMKYASTSVGAWTAGYLIQNDLKIIDLFIFLIQFVASVYFFMCYAERFPTPAGNRIRHVDRAIGKDAIRTYPLIAVLGIGVAVLAAFLYSFLSSIDFGFRNLIAAFTHAGMYFYYGVFLLRHPDARNFPVVRHQLVWPVLLSIGIGFYYGINFAALQANFLSLVPVLMLAGVYFITRLFRFGQHRFLIFTLTSFLAVAGLAFSIKQSFLPVPAELGEYFFTILFCIIVSAYLAVFEAWKISSDIAKRAGNTATPPPNIENINKRADLHSRAALTALLVTVLTLPFFFVYSKYGTIFLVLFGLHSILSLFFWSSRGVGDGLVKIKWPIHKMWVGTLFLGLLVLFSIPGVDWEPKTRTLPSFVSWETALFFTAGALASLFRSPWHRWVRGSERFADVLSVRINITRLLGPVSSLALAILLIVLPDHEKASNINMKGDMAFIFYVVCIVISLVANLVYNRKKPPKQLTQTTLTYIYAFLILTRAITSSIITLAIFLPAVYSGKSFAASVLIALPFFLSAIGGFALNDYFDSETDAINKPQRAIPSGRLSRRFVLCFALSSIALAFFSAILISNTTPELTLYLSCIAGVAAYNVFVKYVSLTKTFLTSAVSSIPILFSVVVFDYPAVYLLLPIATSGFVLGREWLMDIRDLKGDLFYRRATIPMVLGTKPTAFLGFSFQIGAACLLIPIALYNRTFFSMAVVMVVLATTIVLAPLWYLNRGDYRQTVVRSLWLPMLVGLLLFIH